MPELFNLSKFPSRRRDKSIYGYEFEIGDTLTLIFEYFLEPEDKMDPTGMYPKIKINSRKIRNEIEGMFGKEGIKLLVKWLEDKYKLPPVKSYNN